MRLLLTLLILASSAFSATDYAIAVFKIGDQESKTPYKDGELIEIIDPNEQGDNFVLSDEMQTIFLCVKVPINEKALYFAYIQNHYEIAKFIMNWLKVKNLNITDVDNRSWFFDCWDKGGYMQTIEIKALNEENATIIFKAKHKDFKFDTPY